MDIVSTFFKKDNLIFCKLAVSNTGEERKGRKMKMNVDFQSTLRRTKVF